jgi:hypothetical protein
LSFFLSSLSALSAYFAFLKYRFFLSFPLPASPSICLTTK